MTIQHGCSHLKLGLRREGFSSLTVALILLSTALPWGSFSLGADDDAKRVLDETFAARNRLKSGSYRLTGTTSVDREGKVTKYPITVRCLFDRKKELEIYQHTQTVPWEEDGTVVEGGKEITLRFIRRSDCLYMFRGGVGPEAITIWEPKFAIESPVLPLDVRAFGLTTIPELALAYDYESAVEKFPSNKVTECSNSDGIWKIVWKIPTKGPTLVQTLYVDEGHGFTPTRLSLHLASENSAENDGPTWGHRCEVTWKQVGNTWVPDEVHLEQTSEPIKRDLKLEWDRVNEDIDESEFEPKRLGLPGDTLVYDHRTGKPVLIGAIEELP